MTIEYSDLGYCRTCKHEWVLRNKEGKRPSKSAIDKQVGLVCPFCGSGRVRIKKEVA